MASGVPEPSSGGGAINRQLIVNADDYGLSEGVSRGIRDCHRQGLVSSTTAMMNFPGVGTALHRAMRECPRLGVGVHLVLTAGRPILPPVQVQTLLTEDGRFPDEAGMIERLPRIEPEEVKAEWRAQVERFIRLTGREPDHLDSHHHISFLSSALFEIMAELAAEHRCGIRFTEGETAEDMLSDLPPEWSRETLAKNVQLVERYCLPHPDHLNKSFYGENSTLPVLTEILKNLPEGTTELMCHPAYIDRDLIENSVYQAGRASEYTILTDPGLRALLIEHKIELINFQALNHTISSSPGSDKTSLSRQEA